MLLSVSSVKVKVNQYIKSCFVYLSSDIESSLEEEKKKLALVLKPLNGEACIVSWGKWFVGQKSEKNTIYIGRKFSNILGIYDGEYVTLSSRIISDPCKCLDLYPTDIDDWDLLERNSKTVEEKLLDQICFVYKGLKFPIFISSNLAVTVEVGNIEPDKTCVYLEAFTEVHILPRFAPKKIKPTSLLTNKKKLKEITSNHLAQNSFLTQTERLLPKFQKFKSYLSSNEDNIDVVSENDNVNNSRSYKYTSIRLRCCCSQLINPISEIIEIALKSETTVLISDILFKRILGDNKNNSKSLVAKIQCVCKKEIDKDSKRPSIPIHSDSRIVQVIPALDYHCHLALAVNQTILSCLGCVQGDVIDVLPIAHTLPSVIKGLVLYRNEALMNVSSDLVCEEFIISAKEFCSKFSSLVLSKETLYNLQIPNGPNGTISISILEPNDNDTFYNLTLSNIDHVQIAVAKNCFSQNNQFRDNLQLEELQLENAKRCFSSEFDQGSNHIQKWFQQDSGLSLNAVLIHGTDCISSKGCGKTYLSKSLAYCASKSPHFAAIHHVDCVDLRGKKADTILDIWLKKIEHAIEQQPSVLVLDGVDELICQPEPSQDSPAAIFYYDKLAEGFRDMMLKDQYRSSKVIVIATSKTKSSIHEFLIPSSGWHIFTCMVEIKSLDEDVRKKMIKTLLNDRQILHIEDENEFMSLAVTSTQGFTPADLKIVVQRTHHTSVSESRDMGHVCISDLQRGLDGVKPCSLQSLALHQAPDISLDDIGGLETAKELLKEMIIWPTKYADIYRSSPLRLANGVLLYGAPGTGKTLLAGAIANECQLNFLNVKGPELLSKFVGSSEQNVRDLFARAQNARPCLLFFDEFDALAPRRGHDNTGVTDRVVNQLLTQLDGVEELHGVFVLAASSRPDLIDPALLRPGRLDKNVQLFVPNEGERFEILKVLSRKLSISSNVNLQHYSSVTENFTGADLKALMYNAQINALHTHMDAMKSNRNEEEATETNGEQSSYPVNHFLITSSDFDVALTTTRPSLPNNELERYAKRFEEFISPTQPNQNIQKVTLA